jgi:hypothetical protein
MQVESRHVAWLLMGMVSVVTGLLAGCGEFAYKRGANAVDLRQEKADCKRKGDDQTAYAQCMASKGWSIQQLEEFDPVATILPTDNREPALIQAEIDQAAVVAAGHRSQDADKADASQTATPPQAVARKDPMDPFVIGSWWKAGGNPDKLKVDMQACAATLGDGHQPVTTPGTGKFKVTRGMLLCLRQQGWYGVVNK